MATYYNRYSKFLKDGKIKPIPGIFIETNSDDKSDVYKVGKSRLDKLSNLYYNTPYCGWLILAANPELGGLEFYIPDQSVIIIPFPFESAIDRYLQAVNKHFKLYGE